MHPEDVAEGAGICSLCGMDLLPAEELGYVTRSDSGEAPLVVPASAVLYTGKRAVVYVQRPDEDDTTYEGREVVLGPRAGDRYIVREGLAEGERVVVNGAFKIDSELQIRAQPSAMSRGSETAGPDGSASAVPPPAAGRFAAVLAPLYDAYFALWRALAADDPEGSRTAVRQLAEARPGIDASVLRGSARRDWDTRSAELGTALAGAASAEADIAQIRVAFQPISNTVLAIDERFGHVGGVWFRAHCPMAFDFAGADWLQPTSGITNPYFGAEMLRCGVVRGERPAQETAP
jgi:Cu(I)/Ag(I) efflux system membrane fusion protein